MALTQVSTGGIKDGQVHTADLADAQITAGKLHADALDHTYTLGASGSDHYTFTGEGLTGAVNDPTLYLTRGKTYRFVNGNSAGAHPFRIQSVAGAGGTEYNTGVTNNAGAGGSTIIFEVPHDAPDVLYYICTSHASMNGILYVTGALADGSVTTAKIADDAVDADKLANSINTAIAANTAKTTNATHTGDVTGSGSLTIANNAVTTTKIADDAVTGAKIAAEIDNSHITSSANIAGSKLADDSVSLAKLQHGTSSNDGKFLRANNGADPTFETVSGTTINNNADNRVITGSGTANTLEGETAFISTAGTRVGINASGGIITDVPATSHDTLVVGNSTMTSGGIILEGASASGNLGYQMYKQGSFPCARMLYEGASNELQFHSCTTAAGSAPAGEAKKVSILPGGDVEIADGNLKVAASHGIDFSADGSASGMASELLDDYEEGTWSPVIKYGGGRLTPHSDNIGVYTKIGNNVTVTGTLRWSGIADSSDTSWFVRIDGLPFTPKTYSSGYYRTGQTMSATNASSINPSSSSYTNLVIFLDMSASYFYIVQHNVASGGYSHTPTIHGNGTIYGFQLTYQSN